MPVALYFPPIYVIAIMSSLRSLMKSSALSKRIVHPYARYSPSGQLICTACSMNIKGEVLWPSHLSSKVHRNSVKREKEEQEQLSQAIPKRRAAQEEGESIHEQESAKRVRFNSSEMENVRVFSQESETSTTTASEETQQPEASTSSAGFLPPGFFDRPEEAPLAQEQETEGREEDDEWAAFEATLATEEELPVPSTSALTSAPAAATISAPEVLFEDGEDEHGQNGQQAEAEEEAEDDENQETEQEKREREEREELMQRIEM